MTFLQDVRSLAEYLKDSKRSTPEIDAIDKIECGEDAAKHFLFRDGYRNLNHGSFGAYPREMRTLMNELGDECEGQPDRFIRYTFPKKLDESREAVAKYLNAPVETCVFVPNATTGVNTVLRNLIFQPGDVIVYFSTIYGACHKTIDYLTETTPVESAGVEYTYPISDSDLCSRFEKLLQSLKSSGKNPKVAIFDTIVSMPGVRVPFEQLTKICRDENVLSLIDGAHSIGQIPIDLTTLDPDFYISNLHKWLHVPRGNAVFYVPLRNQNLIRSSLPTSHGFVPKTPTGPISPLPPSAKSEFVNNFEFIGTLDTRPWLTVSAALIWRSKVSWSPEDKTGEAAIMAYCFHLARRSGEIVSSILHTTILENEEGTLGECNFSNVALPLSLEEVAGGDMTTAAAIAQWMSRALVEEYNTFMAVMIHGGKFWVRLSAQIYLTEADFQWGGEVLRELCGRVKDGEWKRTGQGNGAVVAPARLAGDQMSLRVKNAEA